MMEGRFSKKTLAEYLNRQIAALEKDHGFTDRTGWNQVDGRGERANRAYGEYHALLTVREVFKLSAD